MQEGLHGGSCVYETSQKLWMQNPVGKEAHPILGQEKTNQGHLRKHHRQPLMYIHVGGISG